MKKILSFVLAAVMLLSVVPMAYAAEVDVSEGTTIKVVGTGADTYTVTVPAKLAPGESGTVKANGTWPSSQTLNVTAPSSVTLTHGTQTMDVGITFAGISKAGSDTGTVSAEETVSVASASALFGTWTGTLTYTVEMVKDSTQTLIDFTLKNNTTGESKSYQAEKGMTWREWIASDYNDGSFTIENSGNTGYIDGVCYNGQYIGEKADNTIVGGDIDFYINGPSTEDSFNIITEVNGKTSRDITYDCDLTQSRDIQFTYNGDGEVTDWEFVGMTEGVDYAIADKGDNYIIITISDDYTGEIIASATVVE